MGERETRRDFMNVDSFSQLPFIRPPPAPAAAGEKPSSSGIHLFGIEVLREPDNAAEESSKDDNLTVNTNSTAGNSGGGSEHGRRFECHYCFRHFPTSQALGGHQNAHRRERLHLKQAQLNPARAPTLHHKPSALDGHNVYGLNYHHRCGSFRFGSAPCYPPWRAVMSMGDRFFGGGPGSATQPISGGPLIWRAPAVVHGGTSMGLINRDQVMPSPSPSVLIRGDESRVDGAVGRTGNAPTFSFSSSSSSSSSPSSQFVCESMPSASETVNLDLHL